MATPAENKKIVRDFYDLTFNKRKPAEASALYFGKTFTQHNPLTGDGAAAFVGGIGHMLETMPKLKVEFKRFVAEGDMVAGHVHFITAPGQRGMSAMDFFLLKDGKIVEHWDAMQDVPEKSANKNTMF